MLNEILARRVLIVLGKGGVGKSTLSAAIAKLATLSDGRAALEEYLRLVVPGRMLLKAVFASRLYQFFVKAAPGLRELMMLGKIYYEAGLDGAKPPARNIIVVDAPASGQAMSLLK